MIWTLTLASFLGCMTVITGFILKGYDPNAINGFGSGGFNPNTGQGSTIPPPTFGSWSGSNGGTANPNYNFGNSMWGYGTGPGGFNPNVGYTTSALPAVQSTAQPSANSFGNNNWGFGTGQGGFNPNPGYSTAAPAVIPTSAVPTAVTYGTWWTRVPGAQTSAPGIVTTRKSINIQTSPAIWNFGGSFNGGSPQPTVIIG